MANSKGFIIHQCDIKSAFINADMDEDVYMEQPKGFEVYPGILKDKGKVVCHLLKSLYGTKQAARLWYLTWKEFLKDIGFSQCIFDQCLFLKGDIEVGDIIYIIIWVDDILSFYHGKKGLANHKEYMEVLKKRFTVKDMGEVKRYIGMQISRNQERGELIVSQRPAITEFLMAFGYQESRTRNTPVTGGIMLAKAKEEDMRTQDPYRSLIGSINYVVQYSRPDLAFSIGLFSRFMSDPTEEHWKYLQNVVKYIAGTVDLCLVYRKWIGDFMPHIGYSDANFVSELESAKSTYGYCTFLGNDLISWKSKLSTTVATSTTVAAGIVG